MKAKKTSSGYVKKGRSGLSSAPTLQRAKPRLKKKEAKAQSTISTPKATPEANVNMGLGKLKGVYQERNSRLDREIKRQGG